MTAALEFGTHRKASPMNSFDLTTQRERLGLTADCTRCFGLCCVAHGFRMSASFAYDKPAGKPCRNLLANFDCTIHRTLRKQGFSGCTAYTCYGAGQKVAQDIFAGIDWRQAPQTAESMFQTFPMVRQLHELLWFITEALSRCTGGADTEDLLGLLGETELLAAFPDVEISWGDINHHCVMGENLLGRVSAAIRSAALSTSYDRPDEYPTPDVDGDVRHVDSRGVDLRGADFRGVDLRGADMRGVDLWGAVLSNADLRGADLRWADLMGVDLGRANLSGADLSGAIYLTQSQLDLADGDARTALSDPLHAPNHWLGAHCE